MDIVGLLAGVGGAGCAGAVGLGVACAVGLGAACAGTAGFGMACADGLGALCADVVAGVGFPPFESGVAILYISQVTNSFYQGSDHDQRSQSLRMHVRNHIQGRDQWCRSL